MSDNVEYNKYLSGKTVCIAGPGSSILETKNNGLLIDSYDVVVRLNRSLPLREDTIEYTGQKTNVLYNSLCQEMGNIINIPLIKSSVEWLVCPYPYKAPFSSDIDRFVRKNQERIRFAKMDLKYYNSIENKLNTRPNTGLLAILDVLSSDIKSLHITGISFMKGGYLKSYRKDTEKEIFNRMHAHGNHSQPPQIQLLKEMLLGNPIVSLDDTLKKILLES